MISTSIEARALNRPRAESQRQAILAYIRSRGVDGASSDETEAALGLPHQTCSARFTELKDERAPLIEPSGEVRKTRAGGKAMVYVVCAARN